MSFSRRLAQLREAHSQRRAESQRWAEALTFSDVAELMAEFCEGRLSRTPDHGGPRDPETEEIGAELAHANRSGFLTFASQPGNERDENGREQRAAVQGLASPETAQKLARLVRDTRLQMRVHYPARLRTDYSDVVPVSLRQGQVVTETGSRLTKHQVADIIGGNTDDDAASAWQVTIYDPEFGNHRLLWDRLSEPDWDNPRSDVVTETRSAPEPADPLPAHQRYVFNGVEWSVEDTRIADRGDAHVAALGERVDRAFEHSNALYAHAARTGNDLDLVDAEQAEFRAAASLDHYNGVVAQEYEESDRRRDANVVRYAEQRELAVAQERQRREAGLAIRDLVAWERTRGDVPVGLEEDLPEPAAGEATGIFGPWTPPAAEPMPSKREKAEAAAYLAQRAKETKNSAMQAQYANSGGNTMSSYGEAGAAVLGAISAIDEAKSQIAASMNSIEAAQQMAMAATDGANRTDDIDQANAALAGVNESGREMLQQLDQAAEAYRGVAMAR